MAAAHHIDTKFELVDQYQVDYAPTKLTQYRSTRTGMQVVTVDRKGPKVTGYFTLATEIFDDSGSPHTLEHLVFMGSKNYPYKGVLDKLANRAYSNTNAWTATDHTAYELFTAGWGGFAQILPVYLEHLIVPTITDEACLTEVWHIDGQGNDAGVVYSEMQGVQNNGAELMDLAARRLLYPEGVGFRYETGGMMEQLRVLTPERIREFHKEMYQPKNLCLIIVGEVDHESLLSILDGFEDDLIAEKLVPSIDEPFTRPWIESKSKACPDLKESVLEVVEFPEEDESMGDIQVGFFGPDCSNNVETAALNVLQTYLSGSSVSVLENKMVEQEQLASSVSVWWDARPKSVIWFQPNSVATEKLEFVEKRLFEILKEVASNPLNMDYMKDCVRRERRQLKFQAESSSEFFSTNVIHDFLFGRRGENSTFRDLKTLDEYDVLESWSDEQWRDFLRKWIVDAPHVSILGKPSKAKAEQLKADEVARLAARKEELGEEGLKALAKKLEDAKAKNDAPIPEGMIEAFPVPDVSTIHFIDTKTARSGLARKLGGGDQSTQELIDAQRDGETDLFVQFQDIPTNFVRINMLLGTSKIPLELKPLLPLFIDNFFNTPVMHEGKQLPFEDVVTELEKDTVAYSFGGASGWADAEGLVLTFQVEPEKYEKAIQWIHKLSFESIFDETRLNAGLSKILADLPDAKRSGSNMMYATSAMVHLDPASAAKARNTLVKAVYLKRIKKILKKEPERVITMLEQLRKALFMPDNMRIAVTADIEKLSELGFNTSVYSHLLKDLPKPTEVNPIVKQYQLLSEAGRNPGSTGAIIVPMSTIDSSFALASAKGPTDYNDPTIPALLVAVSYLDAVEGPMWRAIRGTGLAYGTGFSRDLDGGFMQFRVYRSPDAHKAFAMAKRIVGAFVSGEAPFEKSALEGAVSSIVVSVADEAATMAQAAAGEFVNSVVRGVGKDYNSQLLKNVRKVTVAEIQAAMEAVLMPIFDPATADVFLTCAVVMEEGLVKAFGADGYKTQVKSLNDFREDYGLEAGEDDDEEESEGEGSEEGDSAAFSSDEEGDDE